MFQASRKAKMVPIANRYENSLGIMMGECGGFLGGNWREEWKEGRSVRLESSEKRNAPRVKLNSTLKTRNWQVASKTMQSGDETW